MHRYISFSAWSSNFEFLNFLNFLQKKISPNWLMQLTKSNGLADAIVYLKEIQKIQKI